MARRTVGDLVAIYRLQHGIIGRAKQRPGTAAAHMRYILRPGAATWFSIHVPVDVAPDRDGVSQWMHRVEKGERKNGHLLDKITVSIPREIRDEARYALMESFLWRVTQWRIPYVAAVHDQILTKDEFQPHAHIAFRDRDVVTGKRFLNTTARGLGASSDRVGSTVWFRALWEEEVNAALEDAGLFTRVDRRSLIDQGRRQPRPLAHVSRGTWNRYRKRVVSAA